MLFSASRSRQVVVLAFALLSAGCSCMTHDRVMYTDQPRKTHPATTTTTPTTTVTTPTTTSPTTPAQ